MNRPFGEYKVSTLEKGFTTSGEYYNRKFRRSKQYAEMLKSYLQKMDEERLKRVKKMIEEKSQENVEQ